MSRRLLTEHETEYMRQWYGKKPVAEIAAHFDLPVPSVYRRAHRLGLTQAMEFASDDQINDLIRTMHPGGYSDAEIAAEAAKRFGVRVDRHRVGDLRRDMGLEMNAYSQHRRDRVREKTSEQLKTAGLKSLAEVRNARWTKWKRDLGWPEHLTVRAVQALELFWRHGPLTRVQLCQLMGISSRKRTAPISNGPGGTVLAELARAGMISRVAKAVEVPFDAKLHDNPCRQRKHTHTIRIKHISLYFLNPGVKPNGRQTNELATSGGSGRAIDDYDQGHGRMASTDASRSRQLSECR